MKSKRNPFRILANTTLVMAFSAVSNLHAASISWDGSDSIAWATGANWTGDLAPANDLTTDVALFNLEAYPNQPDAGTTSVAGIQIGDGTTNTASLTLGGTSLTLGTSGISMLANAGAATISSPLVIGTAQNWANNSSNALTISSAITRAAGSALNLSGTGVVNTTMANTNGIIGGWATSGNSGASGATADWLTNDGSGNLVTYTGYTTISTNQTGSTATSGENWKNSAIVAYTGNGTINSLVVTQDFDVMNNSTLTLGSGGLVLSGISRWVRNNAQGSTAGSGQITSGTSELFIDVPSATADASNWRIWTKLVDNGAAVSMVKNGPGDLGLLNSNTYTGGTYLNSGTLSLANGGSLGSGPLRMNGGSLNIRYTGANINLANNIGISGSNHIFLGVARNLSLDGEISGRGDLTLGNSNHNSSIYLNGANTMTGGTIVMVNNTNSVRIANAAFGNANVAWVINNTSPNRNTFDFTDGTISFGSLSGNGLLQANNATGTKTLSVGGLNTDSTFSGAIGGGSGVIALTKVGNGIQTLSGNNSYTGATTVNSGTLQIGDGFTGSISANSPVTIGAAGTLKLNLAAGGVFGNTIAANDGILSVAAANDMTLSQAIVGTGALQKSGAGTLTLSGSSSYSGPTTVSEGGLHVTGAIDFSALTLGGATLSGDGYLGPVTVNNAAAEIANGDNDTDILSFTSLTFQTGATLNLNKANDIASPAIDVTGDLTTPGAGNGDITVNLPDGLSWISGETYDLITFGSFSGSIADFMVVDPVPGLGGRQTATLIDTGFSIALEIGGITPYWTGAVNNRWTTTGDILNWKKLSDHSTTFFATDDVVLFDDNADPARTTVDIFDDDVLVSAVKFNNSALDYTITSSGGFGILDGSSPATLTKEGTGKVTIDTINDYFGATTILDGTLELRSGDIGGTSEVVNDGTLIFNRASDTFTLSAPISGFGDVIKDGAGTQILSGANTYSGDTTINAGTLQVGDGGSTGALGTGLVTNNGSLVFNSAGNVTVQGSIDGTGPLTQAGEGTVTLSSANTYSGGTTVTSGTLVAGNAGALGTNTLTLDGGHFRGGAPSGSAIANNIVVNGTAGFTIAANLDISGTITGSGTLDNGVASGPASLNIVGDLSGFSGTFSYLSGTNDRNNVNIGGLTDASMDMSNATIELSGAISGGARALRLQGSGPGNTFKVGDLNGAGQLNVNNGIALQVGSLNQNSTFSGVIQLYSGNSTSASLTKVGAGTWTLSGNNNYTGDTTVNEGVLAVGGNAIPNTGKLVINGGKVDPMGATEVVDTLFFGNTQKAAGTWGSSASTAANKDDIHFTGTGVVSVTNGPAGNTYSDWAATNASGQTMDQDHDNDGVDNGVEYFMGLSGSNFTANPAPVNGTVTWPMGTDYPGAYGTDYEVQTSSNLVSWDPVGSGSVTVNPPPARSVAYTLPTGGKLFVRLVVKN